MRAIKWIALLLAGALAFVFAIGLLGLLSQWRALPRYDASQAIADLSADVEVVTDSNAVPHILAERQLDAVRTLGFLHARDRLWQMEVLRRTAQGRLSEMFGSATADLDVFLRTLGLQRAGDASYAVLAKRTRDLLSAYAQGVNAYVERRRNRLEAKLPVEFMAFRVDPERWEPQHSVAILKVMSLQLSKNMGEELKRFHYAAVGLGPAEIADLMKAHPDDALEPLPDLRTLLPFRADASARAELDPLPVSVPTSEWASNNWVVAGSRSRSRKPLLANDPHLSFGAPSLWYLAHMSWGEGDQRTNLIGASLPGTPLILLGRNDHVAWGFTNGGADVQDVFIEKLRPNDANQYLTQDGWLSFVKRDEIVSVSGGLDRRFTVRTSRRGPVLPDKLPVPARSPLVFSEILEPGYVPVLSWTSLQGDDRTMDALSTVAEARTVSDLQRTFASVRGPMQAIVAADRDGSIGLLTPAALPVRKTTNIVRGRAPVPGWLPRYQWERIAEPEEVPSVLDPPDGLVVTANTRLDHLGSVFATSDWDLSDRRDRAVELLEGSGDALSIEDMAKVQNDVRSTRLLQLRDLFLERTEPASAWTERLRRWEGSMSRDDPEPLVMLAWIRHAVKRIFEDDLGPAFARFDEANGYALVRVLAEGGARDWCDRNDTDPREDCAVVLGDAWKDAIADLTDRYGAPQTWSFGRAHVVAGKHQGLGGLPVVGNLFNVTAPSSGGPYTLNRGRTSFGSDDPYVSTHGAGYKAIYDLADPERSLFIQNSGQSGNVLSSHYRDYVATWSAGGYVPMWTDPTNFRRNALGSATFVPLSD